MKNVIHLCNIAARFMRGSMDVFWYPFIYAHYPGLELGMKVSFRGKPLIDIRNGAHIRIGSNSQILSRNRGAHVNYGAPSKLFADRPGAQIVIGDNCSINGACIHAWDSITIGANCIIGTGTNIIDGNGHPVHLDKYTTRRQILPEAKPIVIGDDVWITLNCVILPGTHIGNGSIVSANSVVKGSVPPLSLVKGNPAQVVGGIRD